MRRISFFSALTSFTIIILSSIRDEAREKDYTPCLSNAWDDLLSEKYLNLCEENKKKTLKGSITALFDGLPEGVNAGNIKVKAKLRELQKWFIAKLVELHNNCLIEFIVPVKLSDSVYDDKTLSSYLKHVAIRQIEDHNKSVDNVGSSRSVQKIDFIEQPPSGGKIPEPIQTTVNVKPVDLRKGTLFDLDWVKPFK